MLDVLQSGGIVNNQELIQRLFTEAGMARMDLNDDHADFWADLLTESGKALLEAESENQRLRGHLASLQRIADRLQLETEVPA